MRTSPVSVHSLRSNSWSPERIHGPAGALTGVRSRAFGQPRAPPLPARRRPSRHPARTCQPARGPLSAQLALPAARPQPRRAQSSAVPGPGSHAHSHCGDMPESLRPCPAPHPSGQAGAAGLWTDPALPPPPLPGTLRYPLGNTAGHRALPAGAGLTTA